MNERPDDPGEGESTPEPQGDLADANPLPGSWWDGGDVVIRQLLRDARAAKEWLAELTALLRELPAVRGSKTRSQQLDTAHAVVFRDAMRKVGVPEATIGRCMEEYFTAMRPHRAQDAVRKATARVMRPTTIPAKMGRATRNRKDK
jgi:hypothetical protein